MKTAQTIALKIQADVQMLLDGQIDLEEHTARNKASWQEAKDLGLYAQVDAILQEEAMLAMDEAMGLLEAKD